MTCGCMRCSQERRQPDPGDVVPGYHFRLQDAAWRMLSCVNCGNKRCPHATDHRLPCTGSNEPGQPGSVYQ